MLSMAQQELVVSGGATRELVESLIEGLTLGEHGAAASLMTPDVRWWLPDGDGWILSAAHVERALRLLVCPSSATQVEALIVSDDGALAVLELSGDGGPLTSVVHVHAGRITMGMTYLDVGPDGLPVNGDR